MAPVHQWGDVRVFKKEAVSYAEQGFDVTLIARAPNFIHSDGVKIVPRWGDFDSRLLRFLSLPFVLIQTFLNRADVYHLHNPDTIPIAFILKLFGRHYIYDTHEDFEKRILIREWIYPSLRKILAFLVSRAEKVVCKFSISTFVTQESVANRLGEKSLVVGNAPRHNKKMYDRVYQEVSNIDSGNTDFRLVYLGLINKSRGLFSMVEALEYVNKKHSCRLWLIGPADPEDLNKARLMAGWEYVDYIPSVEQELAFAYVVKSDVGLIYIDDVGGHKYTDPNKIYEYMAFSKPFIASDFEMWRDKLGRLGAGIFISAGSSTNLSLAVENMVGLNAEEREEMGRKGREYINIYNWQNEFDKILSVYEAYFNVGN
ncbi:glycosyl transferase, group 1 [Marinobacterium lacunae]|uniref:Glycosyl transferase, group 1 n=1 Tax=Marinobacterium lacunae TaxID=1232683 RepID=A0A081G0C9_9GAMM|nr:glycosyl transferase, group 1 [Marinobacterium lacunae]